MSNMRVVVFVVAILITIFLLALISPEVASKENTFTDTAGNTYLRQVNTLPAPQVPKTTQTPLKTPPVKRTAVLNEGLVKDYAYRRVCEVFGCNQWTYFNDLVMRESGWDPCSYNPGKSNCNLTAEQVNATQINNVACGLGQQLPCGKWDGDWQNPYHAIEGMLKYIQNRYTTPYSAILFHNSHNYY